ncbi:MAG: VWA domain-containing protein [Candidatus Kapabacteria bacterium]|jgi:hypothetical protein|nr:VWA domain-containing protein [Candidatus Kapabacteria bacterium]
MTSYSLGLSGEWLYLIIFVICSLIFTLLIYRRTNPVISNGKKSILIFLRTIGLILLIFALFEPVFTGFISFTSEPKIVVLLDNSESMGMDDVGGNRKQKYDEALNKLDIENQDNDLFKISLFGDYLRNSVNFSIDSLTLSDNSSDISKAFKGLYNNTKEDNVQSVILVSDGSYNRGYNPIYAANEIGLPIFSIGIGDSTEPVDLSIQSIIMNEIAYIDNPVPVNINIKSKGFKDNSIKLNVFENDNLLETREILINEDLYETTVYYTYLPKVSGNRKISVKLEPLDGEISLKNNDMSEFIKVLKNKRIISLFAGAPNSDLSFIKQYLSTLTGIEVKEYIQSAGASFFRQPTEKDISETEMFILVGFPISSTPDVILSSISRELKSGKPIFFISSLNTDFIKLRKLEEYLPFNTASSRAVEFEISPEFTSAAVNSPLLRVNGVQDDIEKWKNLAPVFRTETFVRPKPESEVLANIKVNNVQLNEPFLMSRNVNSRKSIAILGYGLYKWKLFSYASDIAKGRSDVFDAYTKLLENSIRWLSVTDINKKVSVSSIKSNYSKGERVEFSGQVYDDSYLPVDNADIHIKISGDDAREISMISIGNGRYTASIDGINTGDYSFMADVKRAGTKIGSDNGRFIVGETGLEYRDIKMQAALLRNISESSGGKFYTVDNMQNILKDIKDLKNFKEKIVNKRNDIALMNYPWLLALALAAFALEWIIRKRNGML